MRDERISSYARLLTEWCLGVKPDWQVVVQAGWSAQPLLEELARQIGRRGAYLLPRIVMPSVTSAWAAEAPDKLLEQYPPIDMQAVEAADAYIIVSAPDNTRDLSDLAAPRRALLMKSRQPAMRRFMNMEIPYVVCNYPTNSLAQEAGMTLSQFEDFLFDACLLDWAVESREIRRRADRLDAASEVRVIGPGTDLLVNLDGRAAAVDDGRSNMPGGEFYYGPIPNGTNGVVAFSEFPASYIGTEVQGARLEFRDGKVVDASAQSGEDFLLQILDSDEGARTLGEMGIGCNPRITRHMKNTLYDEKIDGTVHFAVGAGLPETGATNESAVHWDIVKDLRNGGRILCDGEVVQEDGRWLF